MSAKADANNEIAAEWLPPFVGILFPKITSNHEPLIDELLLRYGDYDEAIECLTDLDDLDPSVLAEHCILLTADSRSGKTRVLCEYIAERMPKRTSEGLVVPVLYINVAEHPTIRNLSVAILREFHINPSSKDTVEDMFAAIIDLLHNCRVRAVCFDDLHQFVDRNGELTQFNLTNWLRRLCLFGHVALVVSGLDRVKAALKLNEQLYNRFDARVSLRRFDWLADEDRETFIRLVREAHKSLANEFCVPKVDRVMAFRWYVATGGRLGILVKICRRAIKLARKSGKSEITVDLLDKAWRRTLIDAGDAAGSDRPFGSEFNARPESGELAQLVARAKAQGVEVNVRCTQRSRARQTSKRGVQKKMATAMGR